ncbi:uncharacterized protein LOC110877512 isoform X2 [Helianthus annuus]|uniref:uncharacterized protein LOC110877512 isoform X2 n=1 Tax=Helianthus annuus TaxID=4232 RepID=UPI001652F0BE|nr:uncharacterized protein LOC110877512 isoform X2 [Helianthus annuus]
MDVILQSSDMRNVKWFCHTEHSIWYQAVLMATTYASETTRHQNVKWFCHTEHSIWYQAVLMATTYASETTRHQGIKDLARYGMFSAA